MSRKKVVLLVLLLALGALAAVVILRNPEAPPIPADEDHAAVGSADNCLTCHGPDGPSPRGPNHPLGRDCTRCHGIGR